MSVSRGRPLVVVSAPRRICDAASVPLSTSAWIASRWTSGSGSVRSGWSSFNPSAPPNSRSRKAAVRRTSQLAAFISCWTDSRPAAPNSTRMSRSRRRERVRSEEHTSELQSPDHLVCRLLLEKKKKIDRKICASQMHLALPLPPWDRWLSEFLQVTCRAPRLETPVVVRMRRHVHYASQLLLSV